MNREQHSSRHASQPAAPVFLAECALGRGHFDAVEPDAGLLLPANVHGKSPDQVQLPAGNLRLGQAVARLCTVDAAGRSVSRLVSCSDGVLYC